MRAALWLLLVLTLLVPAPVWAQAAPTDSDRDAARALATAGFHLFKDGNYGDALERFRGAEDIFHAPPHVLYIGRCLSKLGRLLEARAAYQKLIDEPMGGDSPQEFRQAQQDAKDEVAAIVVRLGKLTIDVDASQAGLRATLDGRALSAAEIGVAIDVDPGVHEVVVSADGLEPQKRSVSLSEGGSETVAFGEEQQGAGREPDSGQSAEGGSLVGPVVLLGLGGVGIVVGAITGGLALGKKSDLEDACPSKVDCPADSQDLENDGRTLGNVSTVGFVVGGVAAAAGIIWLVSTLAGEPQDARVEPLIGPASLGVRLRF